MTLQTSGNITFADIQTEFGGSNPIGLDEYYSGGAYVPPFTYGSTGFAVPSSGAINMADFLGTTKNVGITLSNQTITAGTNSPSTAITTFKVAQNGKVYQITSGIFGGTTETELETWCSPIQAAPGFQIQVSGATNVFDSGSSAENTWLDLTSVRSWTLSDSSQASPTCSFTAEIRRKGTTTVLATAYIDLQPSQF